MSVYGFMLCISVSIFDSTQVLNTKELTLGVIGPASFARQTQNFAHDRFDVYRAQGWNNQLSNEPAQ